MKVRFFCFASVLLCLLLFSFTVQSQLRKIYLHPKAPGREKQSTFVDSVRFIPLQVKEGVEVSEYYNLTVTQKYFLLTDYINKKLFLYSKDGRFVQSISYNKLGANFYPAYENQTEQITFFGNNKNYALTTKDQVKIKLDWDNPHNKKYFKKYIVDLSDPSFTIKKDIPAEKDIVKVYHLHGDYYIQGQLTTSDLYKDSADYELKLYKNKELLQSLFPYNRVNEPRFLYTTENVSFTKTDSPHINFITRPFCDTVYRMIEDSIAAAYQLVLPLENSLPASFFTKPFKNKTERDNFYRNNGWMLHQVYSFYETPRFIFFMVRYLSNYDTYVYEKKTDITYRTRNIKADSTQFNLQLLGGYGTERKGDKFYKPQRTADLLAFFDKNKNLPIPAELNDFLKGKPPAAAPVIVEFKLKN